MNFRNDICKRIKDLREKKGVLQRDVANALNISLSAYTKLENGERGISSENCIALADYFKVTCDYILRGIEVENVDVCTRTCLKQESIDICARIFEGQENAAASIAEIYRNYNWEIDPFNSEKGKKTRYALERLHQENAKAYIINALLNNSSLICELGKATSEAHRSTVTYLKNFDNDDDIFANEHERDPDFYSNEKRLFDSDINSCRYVAGIAFANFFSEIIKSKDFLDYIGMNDPYSYPISPDAISKCFDII